MPSSEDENENEHEDGNEAENEHEDGNEHENGNEHEHEDGNEAEDEREHEHEHEREREREREHEHEDEARRRAAPSTDRGWAPPLHLFLVWSGVAITSRLRAQRTGGRRCSSAIVLGSVDFVMIHSR